MEIKGNRISLEYANRKDKRLIYDMLCSPETIENMFDEEYPAPTWEDFDEDEPDYFFDGSQKDKGSYLLIKYGDEVIGCISYACEGYKIPLAELDIWMKSAQYLGKGLGVEAIKLLIDYLNKEFSTNIFMIRPWKKNLSAIKAYMKCGFKEITDFKPEEYYYGDTLAEYGDGDYGRENTINLLKMI